MTGASCKECERGQGIPPDVMKGSKPYTRELILGQRIGKHGARAKFATKWGRKQSRYIAPGLIVWREDVLGFGSGFACSALTVLPMLLNRRVMPLHG